MKEICILTDSSIQFPNHAFPGKNLVQIIPLKTRLDGKEIKTDADLKVNTMPPSVRDGLHPQLIPPSVDDFQEIFSDLSTTSTEGIALFLSSHLNPAYDNALAAADLVRGRISIQVIDSQTVSAGLGMLVQVAAEDAARGVGCAEIEHKIRGLIPHVYSLFYIHGLTYLANAGFIEWSQAEVGELISLMPVFTFEEGKIIPLEKVRNIHQLMDSFAEFLDEFSDLYQISLIQSFPANPMDTRFLRDHVASSFAKTPFSEHPINAPLATLFGPNTMGIVTMESPEICHF